MTLDPSSLTGDLDLLERIEKATLRFVVQAIWDFPEAAQIFREESDRVADIGEDITREAMDRVGTSVIPVRLSGKMDYKRARYLFHPDFSLRQALFVDSKAESITGAGTATIQKAQTSLSIRLLRQETTIVEQGTLPMVLQRPGQAALLTTTVFVKYNYRAQSGGANELVSITVMALPNGMLQARYNPDPTHGFWRIGRHAPSRGEQFRVRVGLAALKALAQWRVQSIAILPARSHMWSE